MRFITYILALMLLTACSSTEEFFQDDDSERTPLTLCSVQTAQVTSRAATIYDGTTFTGSAALGLFLKASDGTSAYDGQSSGYDNVQYSTTNGTTWTATSAIKMSSTSGLLYAYYPYKLSISLTSASVAASVNGCSLSSSSTDEYDYMYATSQTVNDHTMAGSSYGSVSLTMNHALARIDLTLKKGTYTASGKVTAIELSGDGIATSGTLNIKDGSISATKATYTATVSGTISTDGITYKCLTVPVASSAKAVTLKCTIDGKVYAISLGNLTLTSGNYYKAAITINDTGMTIDGVSIASWGSGTTGSGNFARGHEYVEIGGVKWATMNVGATTVADSPETAFGDYYSWGELLPYYRYIDYSQYTTSGTTTYYKLTYYTTVQEGWGCSNVKTHYNDWYSYCNSQYITEWSPAPFENYVLKENRDVAHKLWSGNWRMPTAQNFHDLCAACCSTDPTHTTYNVDQQSGYDNTVYSTSTATDNQAITEGGIYWVAKGYTVGGVKYNVAGMLFVTTADTSKRLFFPATGYMTTTLNVDGWGSYWTKNLYNHYGNRRTFKLAVCNGTCQVVASSASYRFAGFTIRPVSE